MADVRPFRGLRYNLRRTGSLSSLLCPPYDIIGHEEQKRLYARSPYNIVRLELGETFATDTPNDNRYTRSAATFRSWIAGGILVQDERPAFYLHRHRFRHRGRWMERLGLFARVRLEEFENGIVLPHEATSEAPKRDRLALMAACRANFSPVMALYRDPKERVGSVLREAMKGEPIAGAEDEGGEAHSLWLIEEEEATEEIRASLAPQPLYLADGHHRYETALIYRNLMKAQQRADWTGEEAFNFVMMALIEMDDPGLLVLPYHRLIGGLTPSSLYRLEERLREVFQMEPYGSSGEGWLDGLLAEVEERGRRERVLGLLMEGGCYILTLKRPPTVEAGTVASSEAWLLEELVLRPTLGDSLRDHLVYTHNAQEAARGVERGEYQMAFLLKPLPLELFEAIVRGGERLPPKSTYFYPKLPTGLVINSLEGL
jgi:uncharacterized protein (DUF1015 family)